MLVESVSRRRRGSVAAVSIRFCRRFVDAVRQEIGCPERVEFGPELIEITRPLFQRLQDHLVTDLADPYRGALEAKFLRQPDGLATAIYEESGGGIHGPPSDNIADTNNVSGGCLFVQVLTAAQRLP